MAALPQVQTRPPPSPTTSLSRSRSSSAAMMARSSSLRPSSSGGVSPSLARTASGTASPVQLSVLGPGGVQQSLEVSMAQLQSLGEKGAAAGILLLDQQIPNVGDSMSGAFEHLNQKALSETLTEENKALRAALRRTRSLPGKQLKGGQFRSTSEASSRRTMKIQHTESAAARAPENTRWLEPRPEEVMAHDRMVNLGRAWSTDGDALSLLLGDSKHLSERGDGGGDLWASPSREGAGGKVTDADVQKRLDDLEALLAALRKELALRNKECMHLRMKNAMLQMQVDTMRDKIKQLEAANALLQAQMAALQAQLDAQKAELLKLREFHDRSVAAASTMVDASCDATPGAFSNTFLTSLSLIICPVPSCRAR